MNKKIVVLKFGGSTFGYPNEVGRNLPKITKEIQKELNDGKKVIAIVSAFKGETRKLEAEINDLDDYGRANHLRRGEEHATESLTSYLNEQNITAAHLMKDSLPIITKDIPKNTILSYVQTDPINEKLQKHDVVVIPGFVGRTNDGKYTLFPYDGSDISALVTANAMKATCTLFKDIPFYLARPDLINAKQKPYLEISYNDALAASFCGARIIHPMVVADAQKNNMDILIKPFETNEPGTLISGKAKDKEKIVALTHLGYDVRPDGPGKYYSIVGPEAFKYKDVLYQHGTPISNEDMMAHFKTEINRDIPNIITPFITVFDAIAEKLETVKHVLNNMYPHLER
ncbi:MAG: hypothetical protein JW812_01675 [Alphaproteobacteria bacterium]|nr:hypothetical protein [Alphaproteobacteria bacterium]MBN2779740.1 hypothetical protein [Alphaproteobacteria bacterium]